MERTIEHKILRPRQKSSGKDKGSRADGAVDANRSTPGPRDLSPRLRTSEPKPEKKGITEVTSGMRRNGKGLHAVRKGTVKVKRKNSKE